jgi:16S rRNA (uracil1498-N3)-methyltransferase
MHKFFVNNENIVGDRICIKGDDVNHIYKVLRLRENDEILISNGMGREYISKIMDINKQEVVCEAVESFDNTSEPPVNITLYQGLPKAQKMELIIQKCVEIGVVKIQPVITQRVVVKIDGKDISNKIDRWNKIAEEAAKQSNRGILPSVMPPISFEEAIEELKNMDIAVIPYEKEKSKGIKEVFSDTASCKAVGIFIGPEGGFEEDEVDACIQEGIKPITLGPRILRTETAGMVASSIILYEIGDMGGCR